MNKEKNNAAAFFDCDGTLTPYTMVHYYLFMNMIKLKGLKKVLFLIKEGLLIPFYLILDKININLFNDLFHKKYKGLDYNKLCEDYKNTFEMKIKANIFNEMKEIIKEHKKNGVHIVIISGSPDIVIIPIAEYLGADKYYTRSLVVKNGIVTGELKSNFMKNMKKAEAIFDYVKENNIDLSKSYAYGDSIHDVAMFKLVGNPFLINGSNKLKELAKKNNWNTINPSL